MKIILDKQEWKEVKTLILTIANTYSIPVSINSKVINCTRDDNNNMIIDIKDDMIVELLKTYNSLIGSSGPIIIAMVNMAKTLCPVLTKFGEDYTSILEKYTKEEK